jgi:hypothetical protein
MMQAEHQGMLANKSSGSTGHAKKVLKKHEVHEASAHNNGRAAASSEVVNTAPLRHQRPAFIMEPAQRPLLLPPFLQNGEGGSLYVFGFNNKERYEMMSVLMKFGIVTADHEGGKPEDVYAPFMQVSKQWIMKFEKRKRMCMHHSLASK